MAPRHVLFLLRHEASMLQAGFPRRHLDTFHEETIT
jgi:hypothetical protein